VWGERREERGEKVKRDRERGREEIGRNQSTKVPLIPLPCNKSQLK
jgi:hypothetical protein